MVSDNLLDKEYISTSGNRPPSMMIIPEGNENIIASDYDDD